MALTPRPPARARRAIWLTHLGLWAEAVARAFWPLWAVCTTIAGAAMLGLPLIGWVWIGCIATIAAAALWGLWRFRLPRRAQAEARVDDHLPGRPLAGLRDTQLTGHGDAGSAALWHAHQSWLARQAARARAVAPNLRLADRDPFGLRLIGMLVLAVGVVFGTAFRVSSVVELPTVPATDGPSWEGWAEPPAYTGDLALYLPDQTGDTLTLAQGSAITLRFYGTDGAYQIDQDIGAGDPLIVAQSGALRIDGPNGRSWQVTVLPDAPPSIASDGTVTAEKGDTLIAFTASDDFGVRKARARISLDLASVARRHGLSVDPDPIDPIAIDLPLPFSRDRQDIADQLVQDFSQHILANMPVVIQLEAEDDAGQIAQADPISTTLTSKRFFQPIARAVAEQRRDFLWARANDARVAQVLRAVGWRPDDLFRNPAHGVILRGLIDQIEAGAQTPEARAKIANAMWAFALELEEGSLADARERLRRAQERLAEAMRNGASASEIQELMDELRAAKEDYMRLLAENAAPADRGDEPDTGEEGRTVTQDEIDRLMDEIQRLMEEGRMDEAQALMEQLNQLLENLTMQQSNEGGDGTPGQQSMEDLGEALREQQELSDDTFRELQDRFNGRTPQDQGEEAPDAQSLADRQQALEQELERQRQALPGLPGEEAEAARRALDRAADAMDRAGDALERDDLPGAISNQGRALELMRDGLSALTEAMRDADQDAQEDSSEEAGGAGQQSDERQPARDPLGRRSGGGGQMGGDEVPEAQDPEGRASDLQDELRRRLGERARPQEERDYLDRLLDKF